jgi:TolB-like protein/Tfp pilus assembly protein PilF
MSRWTEVGDTERAIELGFGILRLDRLHEPTVGRLMQLYNESGRRSAAVQLYRTLTETLRIELNAQPKAETRAVFAEIARGGEDRTSITPAADPKLLPLPAGKAPRSDARAARSQQVSFAAGNAGRARISIAVLPFANMSGDLGQEFFCDGITEEMTTTLAKVPGLVVIGRTSAFKFKGQSRDLCSIGRALRSTHLMEGSVRKAGNRVRISAQLIDAANGTHLWAENYEADLTDIFAVQQDIARSIAGALQAPLGLKPGERQVSHRIDHVNYQQYLRAKALVRARGLTNLTAAAALLERVVSSDPNFAPAWALMAQAYDLTPTCQPPGKDSANQLRRVAGAYLPRAEEAARRAIQLDANHADGHLSLGFTHQLRGELLQAEALFKQALTLDPNNSDVLHYYSQLLAEVGRLNEALAMRQQLHAQEPFVPTYNGVTGALLLVCGQDDASNRMLSGLSPDFPFRAACLARNYAAMGCYGEASDALLEAPSGTYLPRLVDKAAHLLRTITASDSPQTLPRSQTLNFVHLHTVAPESALAFFEDSVEAGYLVSAATIDLWHPTYAPVRKTQRFKAFARKAGLVDYWRTNGWPEFCRPTAGDDFVCE